MEKSLFCCNFGRPLDSSKTHQTCPLCASSTSSPAAWLCVGACSREVEAAESLEGGWPDQKVSKLGWPLPFFAKFEAEGAISLALILNAHH